MRSPGAEGSSGYHCRAGRRCPIGYLSGMLTKSGGRRSLRRRFAVSDVEEEFSSVDEGAVSCFRPQMGRIRSGAALEEDTVTSDGELPGYPVR